MAANQKADPDKGDIEQHVAADVGGRGIGIRHLQTAVMAVSAFIAYAMRVNLSVAIVAMVDYPDKNDTMTNDIEVYKWSEEIQGYILSSFFWGYLITQIPAGVLTERFGGHRFLCSALIGTSLLTMMMPQCSYFGGWKLLCFNRMCQGVCQGFVFPSIFTLLGVWAPPVERSRLSSFSLGAQLLGTVAASPISAYLCSHYGWPSVFYSNGVAGLAVGLVIVFLGADTPENHRMISQKEKQYIQTSLGGAKVKLSVPWKRVLTSGPYWAALITMSFQALVYFMFLTKIPTYLATVHRFSMDDNGVLSALPFFVSWLLTFVFSWSCDLLVGRKWLSLTAARKFFNSIAHFGSALCIIGMGYAENRILAVVLLTAFMGCQGASFTGVQTNFVDLAPNLSGTIFSVANFTSACLGLTGPIIIGFIVTETGSAAQWRIVFYVCAIVLTVSNVIFIIWGTAKTQWWNWPDRSDERNGSKDVTFNNEEKWNLDNVAFQK